MSPRPVAPGPADSSVRGEGHSGIPSVIRAPDLPLLRPDVEPVLFVSGCDGATRRYRCFHQAEQLRLRGIPVAVVDAATHDIVDAGLGHGIVVLHRVAWAPNVQALIDRTRAVGGITLFDIDDLVFEPKSTHHHHGVRHLDEEAQRLYHDGVRRYRRTLLACDGALVPTRFLAERVRAAGRPVWIGPNGLDLELVHRSDMAARDAASGDRGGGDPYGDRDAGRPIVVGYASGSRTHDRDFAAAAGPALLRILSTRPDVRLRIIGPLDLGPEWAGVAERVERAPAVDWRRLPREIARFDISLAPLEVDNPFCQAKSELKWLEASACGVPTVAAATEAFASAIEDGVTGRLARDAAGWQRAIEELLDDGEARRAMGAAARSAVLTRRTTAAQAAAFEATLADARAALAPPVGGRAAHSRRRAPLGARKRARDTRQASESALSVAMIVPEPPKGSGGHASIFRMIAALDAAGHSVTVHIKPGPLMHAEREAEALAFVRANFTAGGATLTLSPEIEPADVVIATSWTTALDAFHAPAATKLYFVQDFEPFFQPLSADYLASESTYRLGLGHITLGPWLAEMLVERYGARARAIDFGVEHDVYRPSPPAGMADVTEAATVAGAAEAAEAIESAGAAEGVESAGAVEPVEPSEAAEWVEPAGAVEPVEPSEAAEWVESAGAAEAVESAGAVESAEAVESAGRAWTVTRGWPTVVFYGRGTTPRRGVPLGLEALRRVKAERPDVEIVLYGDDTPGMADFPYVHAGILTPPELAALYRSSTVGLALSYTNLSFVPLEMAACGLPVVAVETAPAAWYQVDGETCHVVEPTAEAIAAGIVRVLDDAALRRRLVEGGLRRVAEMSWERATAQFVGHVERYVEEARSASPMPAIRGIDEAGPALVPVLGVLDDGDRYGDGDRDSDGHDDGVSDGDPDDDGDRDGDVGGHGVSDGDGDRDDDGDRGSDGDTPPTRAGKPEGAPDSIRLGPGQARAWTLRGGTRGLFRIDLRLIVDRPRTKGRLRLTVLALQSIRDAVARADALEASQESDGHTESAAARRPARAGFADSRVSAESIRTVESVFDGEWTSFEFAPLASRPGMAYFARLEGPAEGRIDVVVGGRGAPAHRTFRLSDANPTPTRAGPHHDPALFDALHRRRRALAYQRSRYAALRRRGGLLRAVDLWRALTDPLPPVPHRPWPDSTPDALKLILGLARYGPLRVAREIAARYRSGRARSADAGAAGADPPSGVASAGLVPALAGEADRRVPGVLVDDPARRSSPAHPGLTPRILEDDPALARFAMGDEFVLAELALRRSDRPIFAIGPWLAGWLAARSGVRVEATLPYPIDRGVFHAVSTDVERASVVALDLELCRPPSSARLGLLTLESVMRECPDAHAVLFASRGDGGTAPELVPAAVAAGAEWIGPIGPEDRAALMRRAAVLIAPVFSNPPLALAEAMACGVVVAAPEHAATAWLLDDGLTALTAMPHPDALALKVARALRDRAGLRAISAGAIARVAEMSAERAADLVREIVEDAAGGSRDANGSVGAGESESGDGAQGPLESEVPEPGVPARPDWRALQPSESEAARAMLVAFRFADERATALEHAISAIERTLPARAAAWFSPRPAPLPPPEARPWPADAPIGRKLVLALRHFGPFAVAREVRAVVSGRLRPRRMRGPGGSDGDSGSGTPV